MNYSGFKAVFFSIRQSRTLIFKQTDACVCVWGKRYSISTALKQQQIFFTANYPFAMNDNSKVKEVFKHANHTYTQNISV